MREVTFLCRRRRHHLMDLKVHDDVKKITRIRKNVNSKLPIGEMFLFVKQPRKSVLSEISLILLPNLVPRTLTNQGIEMWYQASA